MGGAPHVHRLSIPIPREVALCSLKRTRLPPRDAVQGKCEQRRRVILAEKRFFASLRMTGYGLKVTGYGLRMTGYGLLGQPRG